MIIVYLRSEMKGLFKYLIIIFVAAAFSNDASRPVFVSSDMDFFGYDLESTACSASLSATDSDICLPRQVSSMNSVRLQKSARRTGNVLRYTLEFVKSGKTLNAGIQDFVQRNSINSYSSLTEPAHRLSRLGKLII